MKKLTGIILLWTLLPAFLLAQADSAQSGELETVVVTGQYRPQSVKNSVYQVRIISKERIQQQAATKLQDVLNNQLNIRFSQDLATGGSDISMLGLSGQNVKILIDGLPVTGRQGLSNEININQIDINSIERIEIVEGPMSVIYGADALAGVINIITKKSTVAGLSVNARVQEETAGNEYGIKEGIHNQYAGISWRPGKWELGASFGRNYFGGWKDTAVGRELVWHKKDQLLANGYIGYTKDNFSIRYRIDGLDEIITNPGNYSEYDQTFKDSIAYDQEYLTQRVMQQLQASYAVNGKLSLQAQSAYTTFSRQVYSTTVKKQTGDVRLNTAPGAQSLDEFNGFTFRGTAMYTISPVIALQPGVDINLENGKGLRLQSGSNSVEDYAFFISAEITPTSKINIRPGIRFIKNTVYDAPPLIPSINTKFSLARHLDLRLAYAKGFRAPSLRELYYNFFDANHQIIGNPSLKSETSNSFTGSLTWTAVAKKETTLSASLGGFYNDVKNLISFAVSPNDPNIFMYRNIDHYKSRAVNISGNLQYKNLQANLGAAYTGRYNQYAEEDKTLPGFKWSAEINATLGYNFSAIGLNANLYYKYTGKLPYYQLATVNNQQQIILAETAGYHWTDVTLNKKLGQLLTLNAGVRNLFDVTRINNSAAGSVHNDVSGSRPIGYGRSYFIGLLFNWSKK